MSEKVRQYWEERAKENFQKTSATTNDVFLRELEIATLISTIQSTNPRKGSRILDIGCGDGYSTIHVARQFPDLVFLGLDYADTMVESARNNLKAAGISETQAQFQEGDVTRLADSIGGQGFDIIMTDRCLINLESAEEQYQAIASIARHVLPGGIFIAIENFMGGQNTMNEARKKMGLAEIPVRWHNLFFHEDEFLRNTKSLFRSVELLDFSSSYYFATRVIYSKMCEMRGESPDYQHDIHRLAIDLPSFGSFSPIKLAILRK